MRDAIVVLATYFYVIWVGKNIHHPRGLSGNPGNGIGRTCTHDMQPFPPSIYGGVLRHVVFFVRGFRFKF